MISKTVPTLTIAQQNRLLKQALKFLMKQHKPGQPGLVYVNYTLRGHVRGILGRPLASEVGL